MKTNICRTVRRNEAKYIALSKERHGLETMYMACEVLIRCNCIRLACEVAIKISARLKEKNLIEESHKKLQAEFDFYP
jgi:hypothetical protein